MEREKLTVTYGSFSKFDAIDCSFKAHGFLYLKSFAAFHRIMVQMFHMEGNIITSETSVDVY
jgi:hypothetical protein